jgi:hypothetical protein
MITLKLLSLYLNCKSPKYWCHSLSVDLLLSQMGYFRDITTGQSLEDVDISVHCDVAIFEWLMAWLR